MTNNLKPGAVITVPKSLVKHYGIYLDRNTVIHATPKTGRVCETSLADFEGGERAAIANISTKYPPEQIISRARERLGKPYKLFTQNCEHFVTEVLQGRPTSHQAFLGGVAVVGLFIYLSRK